MNNWRNDEQSKRCFIITPIGELNSDIYRKAKGVIESVIRPELEKNGFSDIKSADEISESGMINNQIIRRIIKDDLVVANLTGNNPNVMYELAIRHAVARPIIHICEQGTKLPFDVANQRIIYYVNDMMGSFELSDSFRKFVEKINYSIYNKDNPICVALGTDGVAKIKCNLFQLQEDSDSVQTAVEKINNMYINAN